MQISDLKKGAHIHLMGICGTAMASLAGLLKDKGFHVSGSDSNPYPPMSTQIESLGIEIKKPYQASNLNPQPDFVIVGNVISANNPEAQELHHLKIPYTSLPKAMGEFIIAEKESIVIAGTHGKTTTTSLMSWICTEQGFEPGFLIGGIAKNFSKSFQNPKGKYFIIEGDEYDTAFFDKVPKFIHYRPRHVILTSVEFDHADIYKDLNSVKDAFSRLIALIPQDGSFLWCAEDGNVAELARQAKVKNTFSYGIQRGDYRALILSTTEKGARFSVQLHGSSIGEYECQLTGEYNVLNCLSVIAMGHVLKWDLGKIKSAMKSFEGVKRRQEVLGEPNGVLVIEDFAHHPTAVKETIKGIKDKFKNRKVFAVFEPRSATSRRKIFQKDYVQAFLHADDVLIMKAFDQSKISESERFSSEELTRDIFKAGRPAKAYDTVEQIISDIKTKSKSGDLILIMSNGGFDGIYTKLLNALEAK